MTTLERIRYRQRMRKIRNIKRLIILTVITLFLAGGLALTLNVIDSDAQNKDVKNSYKYFTSITVEYGDTLYTLAKEHTSGHDIGIQEYIEEVMHINHLEDETLQSGQSLVIPYYSEEFKGI